MWGKAEPARSPQSNHRSGLPLPSGLTRASTFRIWPDITQESTLTRLLSQCLIFLIHFQINILIFLQVTLTYQPGHRHSELGKEMHESAVCKQTNKQNTPPTPKTDGCTYPIRRLGKGVPNGTGCGYQPPCLPPCFLLSYIFSEFLLSPPNQIRDFPVYARNEFRIVHETTVSQKTQRWILLPLKHRRLITKTTNKTNKASATWSKDNFENPLYLTDSQQHTFLIRIHADGGRVVVSFLCRGMECFLIQNLGWRNSSAVRPWFLGLREKIKRPQRNSQWLLDLLLRGSPGLFPS